MPAFPSSVLFPKPDRKISFPSPPSKVSLPASKMPPGVVKRRRNQNPDLAVNASMLKFYSIQNQPMLASVSIEPAKLGDRGLATTEQGWVRVNDHFQSVSHPYVFAAGDCCNAEGLPNGRSLPKAGVFAVRAGPVLIENLSKMLFEDQNESKSSLTVKSRRQM